MESERDRKRVSRVREGERESVYVREKERAREIKNRETRRAEEDEGCVDTVASCLSYPQDLRGGRSCKKMYSRDGP